MHLIVCVDERDGMAFCGRRLSRDKEVSAHICKLTEGHGLWLHAGSAQLFPQTAVKIAPDFLEQAQAGEYCFVETIALPAALDSLESVILYHWNRAYPSNLRFPRALLSGMRLEYTEEFPGNSHDKITMERYIP